LNAPSVIGSGGGTLAVGEGRGLLWLVEASFFAAVLGEGVAVIHIPQDAGPGHSVVIGRVLGVGDGVVCLLRVADKAAKVGFAIVLQKLDAGPAALEMSNGSCSWRCWR